MKPMSRLEAMTLPFRLAIFLLLTPFALALDGLWWRRWRYRMWWCDLQFKKAMQEALEHLRGNNEEDADCNDDDS